MVKWFGQMIQRSDDGGATWQAVGNEFTYDGVPGTHQWYDGTQHPWEFKRVWHLEPSLTDPDTVFAGAEDAALFRPFVFAVEADSIAFFQAFDFVGEVDVVRH